MYGILPQKELQSSWFGQLYFQMTKYFRKEIIELLENNKIETRPMVMAILQKEGMLEYFDYEVHGKLTGAKLIEERGFFVGNHHYSLKEQIHNLSKILKSHI